jgi:hypothetical protein
MYVIPTLSTTLPTYPKPYTSIKYLFTLLTCSLAVVSCISDLLLVVFMAGSLKLNVIPKIASEANVLVF